MKPHRLFCYGSLQVAEVIGAVIGRAPARFLAALPNFEIYRIRDAVYPGISPEEGASAPGVVFAGLTDDEMDRLDVFEGEPYERKIVEIQLQDGLTQDAWVYLLPECNRHWLTDERWDLESFKRDGLRQFVRGCFDG